MSPSIYNSAGSIRAGIKQCYLTGIRCLLRRLLSACCLLMIVSPVYADSARLALDMRNINRLPKNFRIISGAIEHNSTHINTYGLSTLRAVGSGQFSVLALKNVLDRLPSSKVTVVDLRQEPHGFVNANAVSWYSENNAINAGKTMQQIEMDQSLLLRSLLDRRSVKADSFAKGHQVGKPVEFAVHRVASEAGIATQLGLRYKRLYVQDHHAPDPEQVDRFIQIVNHLPKDSWVYFHCRAGRGRTSTFMLMYDIMRNGQSMSLKDLLKRQAALGGKDLLLLPDKSSSKYRPALERIRFIKHFYQYITQSASTQSWSSWIRQDVHKNNKMTSSDKTKNNYTYCRA